MTKTRKNYYINNDTLEKLEQLVAYRNANGSILIKENQTTLVNEAIELLHSTTFGNDILIHGINHMELQLTNTIKNVMDKYLETLLEAYNFLNEKQVRLLEDSEFQIETLVGIFRSVASLTMDSDLDPIIQNNDGVRNAIEVAIKRKKLIYE